MEMTSQVPVGITARDLSRVDSFDLGPLRIDPPTRTIASGATRKSVEPRVMQVLVALGLEPGQVLSRDDLIALCWDGRIVGDNAINRVISLLRHALSELAGDAVRLETITKVGFRIVVAAPGEPLRGPARHTPEPGSRQRLGRRGFLAGGALIAGAVGAGGWTMMRRRGHVPDPRAADLARRADLLMKSGLPGTTRQATSDLEQAVQIDPLYSQGWGMLAGMYRHSFQGFDEGERSNFPRMVRSASERALELDPGQPDALLALALMRPFLGRWGEAEKDIRAILRRNPDHWYANAQQSLLLLDTGRAEAALPFRKRSLATDSAIPVSNGYLALNQMLANRLHDADATLERAAIRWPTHPALWFFRLRILLETGRPRAAAAFARDSRFLPDRFPPEIAEEEARYADAIASRDRAVKQRAVDRLINWMEVPESVEDGATMLALLGEGELAMEACAAGLRGGTFAGRSWPAPGDYDMRSTAFLFYPSLLALSGLPAYRRLLRDIGLEAYWRQSGSQPDFRHG